MSNPLVTALNERVLSRIDAALVRRSYLHGLAPPRPTFPMGTWVIAQQPDGLRIWVDLGDFGMSREALLGGYEDGETRFIEATLRPGDSFLDVGANIGWHTLHAARRVGPGGRVIAVEPRGDTHRHLVRSIAENRFEDWVAAHNLGLKDEAGEFHVVWDPVAGNPAGTWTLSTREQVEAFEAGGWRTAPACFETLDGLIGERPIHLVKLDAEGAEGLVLDGATAVLRNQRPTILCELNGNVLSKVSGCAPTEMVAWMAARGYRCHGLHDGRLGASLTPETLPGEDDVGNVVFVPDEHP